MSRIFLGPAIQWLIIIVLAGLTWLAGTERVHVSHFNPFVSVLVLVSIAVIVLVIWSSPKGQQVTREPLQDDVAD